MLLNGNNLGQKDETV